MNLIGQRTRSHLGTTLVLAALAAFAMSVPDTVPAPPAQDSISANEHRFDGVLPLLPSNGVVGYLSDLDPNSTNGQAAYMLTQYTLAPRVVARDTNRDWVIGNFGNLATVKAAAAQNGLVIVRNFGNGILLLRRKTP